MILVVGDVMTDIIVRPHGKLVPGSDRAATIRDAPGGSGANQAAWLGVLGAQVAFIGRVGATDHATQSELLRGAGVRPLLAADPDLPTGRLVTLLDPDGERSFLTDRGANDGLCAADLLPQWLDGARLLHVSGYSLFTPGPRAAVLEYASLAARRGIAWSVDAGSSGFLAEVGPAAFLAWTDAASLFVANAAEAETLTGETAPAAQLAGLGAGRRTVVIKRGAAGAVAAGPGQPKCEAASPCVVAVDTTGAGDAFLAGFLLARLVGDGMRASLAAGVAQGARAATRLGGRPAPLAQSFPVR
jgi:sugar/nucleoside kinase (ribokinase family)